MQRASIAEKALHIAETAAQQPVGFIHFKGTAALGAVLFNTQGHAHLLFS